ncbi:MAG: hypothetical protein D6723_16750 [Acidobacteria bacterium]|nr:MAG: hypothetical protein D6723_16750 [Acidobacteriota bacterium]
MSIAILYPLTCFLPDEGRGYIMIQGKSILKAMMVLVILCLNTVIGFAQQQVGIPFQIEKGFVLEFAKPYERLTLDIGENDFTPRETIDVIISAETTFVNRGDIPIEKSVVRPGMEVDINGERFRTRFIAHEVKVTTKITSWEVEVNGYFEKLEGDAARIDGQTVILAGPRFEIPQSCCKQLRSEGVPKDIRKKLKDLKLEAPTKEQLLRKIEMAIGKERAAQYGPAILRHVQKVGAVTIQGKKGWQGRLFRSFSEMMLGSQVEIKGQRQPEGYIIATEGTAQPNLLTGTEKMLIQQVQENLTLPPPERLVGGRAKIGGRAVKFVNDLELQQYVTKVGYKLIPRYIRDMPRDDPAKLTFRFYVIQDDTFNALALPDGSVFINTGLLKILKNEAQLAAVLGHEIAHITYEHPRQRWKKLLLLMMLSEVSSEILRRFGLETIADLTKFGIGFFSNKFSRELENQADRVGLFYMYDAGYDPREAPKVWREILKFVDENAFSIFLYSDHPAAQQRLRNLNREIAYNYYNADLSKKKVGEDEYHRVVGRYFGLVRRRR